MAEIFKPETFYGVCDKKHALAAYYTTLKAAIEKRNDVDWTVKEYLHILTDKAYGKAVSPQDIREAYNKVKDDVKMVGDIQKNFGELLAPIITLKETKVKLKSLALYKLNTTQSRIFIPSQGNFPLVDFMIYHKATGNDMYRFSVKIKGGTTNVIKPQDIIDTIKEIGGDTLMKQPEYKVLQILQENNAQHGPIAAIVYLDQKAKSKGVNTGIKGAKATALRTAYAVGPTGKMRGSGLSQAEMEKSKTQWEATLEPFMKKYYPQMLEVWQTSKWKGAKIDMPYEKALSITCQYALGKISKNEGKLKYKQYLDAVKTSVSYFKFKLETDGTFSYDIENDTNATDNKEYYLRAKNTPRDSSKGKTRAYADKIGVQP
jgi:hypothetical protein